MTRQLSRISYSHWVESHSQILEGFCQKRVVLLFSGGKDSSIGLDFLLRSGDEMGFDIEAHAAAIPPDRYGPEERDRIDAYWKGRGLRINWHHMPNAQELITEAINPCEPCRRLRKQLLFTNLSKTPSKWEDIVLIINHTLWDVVSYAVEHILSDRLSLTPEGTTPPKSQRFFETAQRFYPLLRMKGGYTVFRPMIRYNSNDIEKHVHEMGIPTLKLPCRFSDFRPKRALEQYYQKMESRFDYDRVISFAKQALGLPGVSSYHSIEAEEYLLNVF